jgi:hypothetical protein
LLGTKGVVVVVVVVVVVEIGSTSIIERYHAYDFPEYVVKSRLPAWFLEVPVHVVIGEWFF